MLDNMQRLVSASVQNSSHYAKLCQDPYLKVLGQPADFTLSNHCCSVAAHKHRLACHKYVVVIQLIGMLMTLDTSLQA